MIFYVCKHAFFDFNAISVQVLKESIFMKKPKMHSQSTFSITLTLIFLLMAGQISIHGERNVKETNVKPLTFEDNICSLYDNSKVIDSVLFRKNYKPLVIIIADKISDGINRVTNFSERKRILNDNRIKHNPYYSQLHKALKNIHLYQANDTYYFVYPVNIQYHFLTVYSQRKLLSDNSGITFDFVNVKKQFPFFEDILIPLEPSCTNCTLARYIGEKLQKGESFSELFELRKQLFREKETKNLSFQALNNFDNICTWMGFNVNSQSASSLMRFNSLLNQIKSNSKRLEKNKKRRTVKRNLICFQSRHLEVTELLGYGSDLKDVMVMIDYLNWINNTVSSLKKNDISFVDFCENEHKIDIFKLFCFVNGISGIMPYKITEWIQVLKKRVAESLISKLHWFNSVIFLYNNEYSLRNDYIFSSLDDLKRKMLHLGDNCRNVMNIIYNIVKHSLSVNNNNNYIPMDSTICTIYEHWKTIDDLLFDVKFKRLVIIVVDDMKQGITTVNKITTSRVVPKVRREDLHYSEQFLYDVIMKNIYLVQSNDTHYYVYPTTINRQENPLIGYFEYKMIKDYSNVFFYFVNSTNYFFLNESSCFDDYDSLIHALLDYRDISSGNIQTRFINPAYLIKVHQDFFNRFPKYFSTYTSVNNDLTQSVNNYDQHSRSNCNITYFQEFRNFLKQQYISFGIKYIFKSSKCSSSLKLNKRTDIDFQMTEYSDVLKFSNLVKSTYENIKLTNDTNNNYLKILCNKKEIFKFLKFVCFLKFNYIDDMLEVIDQESDYVRNVTRIIDMDKKLSITTYLTDTMDWIDNLSLMNLISYNNIRVFKNLKDLYSKIPKITFNGTDLSNKIFSIVKSNTIFLQCKKLGFVDTEEMRVNVEYASTENPLILSENKTPPKFHETVRNKAQRKKLCLVPT
ncbi:uncharacterized protein LOC122510625 [Leptopilina heterotoma]|uniref:uncharacterized protein LOC122510625 n=1 Tax=Leptopilina heterotoma TaxID=63436 RepID=UPI001CA98D64|nr:uncharacterized protein LOC122510625 [Leptopilina heterotoma]